MRRQRLNLPNFSLGMRRDGALQQERVFSLRTLKNYFIDYVDGRLKVRNGYTRWNAVETDNPVEQLYHFVDLSLNERVMGIFEDSDDDVKKWHILNETGSHTLIKDEVASPRRPIVSFGNRVMFGTDADMYWMDSNDTDYRLGIVRPPGTPLVARLAAQGNFGGELIPSKNAIITGYPGVGMILTDTASREIAAKYVPSANITIGNILIYGMPVYNVGDSGSLRMSLWTGVTEPTALVSTDAVSAWIDMAIHTSEEYTEYEFVLEEPIDFVAGTTYWVKFEPNETYYENFNALSHFFAVSYNGGAAAGTSLLLDDTIGWYNDPHALMMGYNLGGLVPGNVYDYRLTYYNETYKSESRPGNISTRIQPSQSQNFTVISTPSTLDPQVDTVRIYRRNIGTDPELAESEITAKYFYLGKTDIGQTFTDTFSDSELLGELQTDDHYLYDEFEDEGGGFRESALIPATAVVWKSRIWFVEADANTLYFSKVLEQDGANGLTADAAPDYFPLENMLEFEEPSAIIALRALPGDELAVYFRNTSIWILRGANEPLNPPSDISKQKMVTDFGLIAAAGVDDIRGQHVFLSRRGVYSFNGTPRPEFLSDGIQTILDGIADSALDDSVIVALGDSIWLLVDEDEDGDRENIYIMDMQRPLPTWRLYSYNVALNDLLVLKTGTEYKTLLAADAENNYILKLEDGTTDNGQAIVAEIETHDLPVPNLSTIFEIALDAYYPGTPSSYEITITDAKNDTRNFDIMPRSVDDIRGHRTGCLVTSVTAARVSVLQRAVEQNHLRGLAVAYVER